MHDMAIVSLGSDDDRVDQLKSQYPHAHVTRFYRNIYSTVIRCVEHARTSHMWIVLACSDCKDFDFNWDPVPGQSQQIHCWSAGTQKYGDILLIPVAELKKQAPECLEWFHDINYHPEGPNRHPWPAFFVGNDDLTQSIRNISFDSEYAWFCTGNSIVADAYQEPALWGEKHHELISFAKDNSVNLVPRHAKLDLMSKGSVQIYDYANLHRRQQVDSEPQDIVFISYDEPQADENWATLIKRFPNAKRVHGVSGMENALKAAARASSTPWFYATFAKTRLHEDWNFGFVPDRWQSPKHYIFNALNASNGLCYGHMGIILYHKQLVLDSKPWEEIGGMDFTMSFATESIPLTSVYGDFAITPYHAWRTAFREVSKLCQWQLDEPSVETDYRIHVWRTHATGPNAEWVLKGANDGAEFFAKNISNPDELKKAFRWEWLKDYFTQTHPSASDC